ncbi:SET domain-protein 5 [Parachaetomium inaequale]|uniref:SET domain-protein 5 n=1 Tax=Parachaetomium inaequale TaxID=2588326 RepID=A0AAN6P7P2_9PEZI|nr:SET domain-protein 5 [Parachaetomium inaequale]
MLIRASLSRHSFLSLLPFVTTAVQTQCRWNPTLLSLRPTASCPLPVDDGTPAPLMASRGVPWTHPPHCVIANFAGPTANGIAVIASPETAADVVAAVKDPLPAWSSRRHLARHGRLRTETSDLPYAVTPIPRKGLGVIATKRINQFETIITSFPAMVADNKFFPSKQDHGPVEGAQLFQKALDQLPDKERFLNLARSKGEHVHVVEDVVRINAFGITVDGREIKGLYPEIARLNHACGATAYNRFTKKDLDMSAIDTRDIEPGEEITISYIPLGMPTAYRTRALSKWGFTCTRDLCSAASETRGASDQRRERLLEVYYTIQDESTSYNTLVELTHELIELVQVERLLGKLGGYYQALMQIYYGIGDPDTARKYGHASLKFANIFSDTDGGFCTGLKRDLERIDREVQKRTR